MISPYIIFKRDGCRYCDMAIAAIEKAEERYIVITIDDGAPDFLQALTGTVRPTVPQIFHKGDYIGGYTSLEKYLNGG